MSDKPTVHDYDSEDGWNDSNGTERCPHCEMTLGTEGGYHGIVIDTSGRKYEHFVDTTPGEGPYYCPDCYDELESNRRAHENESIEEFL